MRVANVEYAFVASFTLLTSVFAIDNPYIIFPIERMNVQQSNELDSLIKGLALSPSMVYVSRRANLPVPSYWVASLQDRDFEKLKAHPLVCNVHP